MSKVSKIMVGLETPVLVCLILCAIVYSILGE